jgi:hypothetical protein
MWRLDFAKMVSGLLISLTIVVMTGCSYRCDDHRATYFDADGRVILDADGRSPRRDAGITEGFVLIPALGDAGYFMLGQYVRISKGRVVERFEGTPDLIHKNFWVPYHNGDFKNPPATNDATR